MKKVITGLALITAISFAGCNKETDQVTPTGTTSSTDTLYLDNSSIDTLYIDNSSIDTLYIDNSTYPGNTGEKHYLYLNIQNLDSIYSPEYVYSIGETVDFWPVDSVLISITHVEEIGEVKFYYYPGESLTETLEFKSGAAWWGWRWTAYTHYGTGAYMVRNGGKEFNPIEAKDCFITSLNVAGNSEPIVVTYE